MPNLPPELQVLLLPTYMRFRDSPGSKEAADLMAKFRDSKFPGLVNEDGEKPSPEQLQSQLQGQQQKMQEMGQQLQMAIQQIQTDQAKQQAQMMKAQLDAQTKQAEIQAMLHKAEMDNAAKVLVARIGSEKEAANQHAEAQEELLATGLKIQAEHVENALDRAHEKDMSREDKAHEVGMGAATGNTAEFSREGGQETAEEQSEEQSQGAERESTQGARKEPEPAGDSE